MQNKRVEKVVHACKCSHLHIILADSFLGKSAISLNEIKSDFDYI